MRIVIEIKKGEASNVILNRLYKLTQLQESYGINLLAIHQGQPKTFNLRDMIWAFVDHRKDVVVRRTVFELKKAEARAHILEGLKTAVENIDTVIALIKAAKNPDDARVDLMGRFKFTEIQAQAILDMRLQRLTGLEREKIIEEYKQVLALIEELRKILSSESLVFEIIKKELLDVKKTYGDERRTQITIDEAEEFEAEDLIAEEETLVTITRTGYVKRSDPSQFRAQGRGGKGIRGMTTGDEDFVTAIYSTTTLSYLLCFTDRGRLYALKVYKIPEASRAAKGKAIVNLLALAPGERILTILAVREFKENEYVVMVTRNGTIKKTALDEFSNIRSNGLIAIGIEAGDELVSAKLTNGTNEIFLCSKGGQAIRFLEEEVRAMGRAARGVAGMDLEQGDVVVSMDVLSATAEGAQSPYEILTVSENGYGKRTPVTDYRLTHRGGKGVINMKSSDRNGGVLGSRQVLPKDDLMLVSNKGQMIRIRVGEISEQGRNAQGVRLMTVSPGERVVSIEYLAESSGTDTPPGDAAASGNGQAPAGNGAGDLH
jgi:DNA gyrase subunit A